MNINTNFVTQLIAKTFLVVLSTTVFVYIIDDVLLKEHFDIWPSIYSFAGGGFLLFGFLSGYYLFKLRNQTPKNSLVKNNLLLLVFVVLGLAYISGLEIQNEISGTVLDFVCLATFYFVTIRILQISNANENDTQVNTVPLKYQLKKAGAISFGLASILILLNVPPNLFPKDGNDSDLSINFVEPTTDEEIEQCMSNVECRIPMYLSAQLVQSSMVASSGSSVQEEDGGINPVLDSSYETELEKLTHGEAKLLGEQASFSRAQLTEYTKVLVRPYMQELAKALQLYTINGDMSAYDSELFITKHKYKEISFGLDSYDPSYFKSTFSPFGIYEHFLGGKDLLIIFHEKPDRLFRVWMKEQNNGTTTEWLPMTIYDTGIPKEEVEQLYWQYKKVDEGAQEIIKLYGELGVDVSETLEYMDAIASAEEERGSIITEEMTAEEVHTNPYISHIRTALDNYLAGSVDGIEETAIETIQDGCGLSIFDRAYYKSPFILFEAEDGEFGGVNVDLVFLEKPDRIFSAWVYQYGTGELVLRGFCDVGPSEEDQVHFDTFMKEIMDKNDYYQIL